ncbi:RNA polymerase ECF-type sigma factor [Filimonas lacunae]|nr:RNA polymerase ECF-type sigma factor [Filimonas lacunae]
MQAINDTHLLEDFKRGNVQAFEQVFTCYYSTLKTAAFLLLDDEQDAEDIVQQLFEDIWTKELYKNIDISVKAYLHTAVRNKCLNFLEKRKVYERQKNNYAENLPVEGVVDSTGDAGLPDHMHNALKELPPQRQAAFKLVYMEERSYKDAAGEMGISVNSLKTHLKMGLRFLRNALEKAY